MAKNYAVRMYMWSISMCPYNKKKDSCQQLH
jgi:hypothetical protein